MKRIFFACFALFMLSCTAGAEVCYHSSTAVRQHTGMWPSYTLRMAGHPKQKCWYPKNQFARAVKTIKRTIVFELPKEEKEEITVKSRVDEMKLWFSIFPIPENKFNFEQFNTNYEFIDRLKESMNQVRSR